MAAILEQLRRGELAGARSLDLSGSGLSSFPPEIFGLTDTLEQLDLGRNPLSSLPHDLGRLRRLRVLFCSGTSFRVLPPALGDCPELSQVGFCSAAVEIVLLGRAPAGEANQALDRLRKAATAPRAAARPRFAEILEEMSATPAG